MRGGTNRRCVDQRAERDMHASALQNQRVQQGTAFAALGVVCFMLLRKTVAAETLQNFFTRSDSQLVRFDTGERFESRAGGAAAVGAMAVQRVLKAVFHRIARRTGTCRSKYEQAFHWERS